MPQINDCIYNAVGGPVNDFLLAYYQANGATSDDMMTAAKEFLAAQGAADGALMDMWREFLTGKGYTGALADQLYQFWCNDLGAVCDSGATKDGSNVCSPYYININFCDTVSDIGETPYDGMTLSVDGDSTTWTISTLGTPVGPNNVIWAVSPPLTSFEQNIVANFAGGWTSHPAADTYNISNSCLPDPTKILSLPEFDATTGRLDVGNWYNTRTSIATFLNSDGYVQETSDRTLIYEGARVVENLLPIGVPEAFDSTNDNWFTDAGGVDNGDGSVTLPEGGRATFQVNSFDALVSSANKTLLASVEIKGPVGKQLEIRYQGDGPSYSFGDGSILTFGSRHTCNGEWQRVTPGSFTDPWGQDGIRVVVENESTDTQGSFDIELRRAQVEISSHTDAPDVPSEYESTIEGFGAELYDDANALLSGTDVDALTSLDIWGTTSSSQSAVTNGSDFAVKADSSVGGSAGGHVTVDLDNFCKPGLPYVISIDARHLGSGGDWIINVGPTNTDYSTPIITLTSADTDWVTHKITIPSYSSSNRYLILRELNTGNDGGVYIDNLSIKYVKNGVGFYNRANGNSVNASGIVTEAVGSVLASAPWMRHQPAATNACTESNDFTTTWSAPNLLFTANAAVGPMGLTDLTHVYEVSGGTTHSAGHPFSVTSGQQWVISFYASAEEHDWVQLSGGSAAFGSQNYLNFNLSTGAVGTVGTSIDSYGIEEVPGVTGLYRCWAAMTATGSSSGDNIFIILTNNADSGRSPSYSGDGSSGVNVGHVQFELGATPSSYVATNGASASRTTDQIRINRTAENWDNDKGTVIFNFEVLNADLNTKFGNEHLFGTNTPYYTTMYSSTTANLRTYDNTTDANSAQVSGNTIGIGEDAACAVMWDITWGNFTIGSATADVPAWDFDEIATYNGYTLQPYLSLLNGNPNMMKIKALDVYDRYMSPGDIASRYVL